MVKIKDIPLNDRPIERLINNGVENLSTEEILAIIIKILFLFGISYIFEYGYEIQQDTKAKMYGDTSNNE